MLVRRLIFILGVLVTGTLLTATKTIQNPIVHLVVFQGSDWCANCIRFEKNVLSDSVFIQYAQSNNLSVERIDFPQRKKLDSAKLSYNARIAKKYNFQGEFPTVLLVGANDSSVIRLVPKRNQTARGFVEVIRKRRSELK